MTMRLLPIVTGVAGFIAGSLLVAGAQTAQPTQSDANAALSTLQAYVASHPDPTTTTTVPPTTTTTVAATTVAPTTTTAPGPNQAGCGLASAAFCATFDQPAGNGSRSGDLDPVVWGVSRTNSGVAPDQNLVNPWHTAHIDGCGPTGDTPAPKDVRIFGGRLCEATNDGDVQTVLAMYPKQPFDFANRTGTITFDLSSDSQGTHGAWPEIWITDTPQPTPLGIVNGGAEVSLRNGIGFQIADDKCHGDPALSGINMMAVVTNYVSTTFDTLGKAGCVADGHSGGPLNHFEVRVSTSHIEVWGTDPGASTLVKLAAADIASPISRGLVWLEDIHYNASKDGYPAHQTVHTFAWDNLGFDGPKTYRDRSYDVPDGIDSPTAGVTNLGYIVTGTARSFTVANVAPAEQPPTGAWVTLNWNMDDPVVPDVRVNNGAWHTTAWPYSNDLRFCWRSIPISVSPADVQPGTNTVQVRYTGARGRTVVSNINLILVAAAPVP